MLQKWSESSKIVSALAFKADSRELESISGLLSFQVVQPHSELASLTSALDGLVIVYRTNEFNAV